MLLKLSLSSMRKMLKDYLVLLIGLVISISVFYMFQTLALNSEFTKENSIISSIQLVFNVGAFLLAFITIFYIFYANSFLLSLRRKELGMYRVLGAKRGKISQILFLETLAMGILSLIVGSLVGIGLAGGIGSLLMDQLDISAEGYQPFYTPALLMTGEFFIVLFLITSTVNAVRLARATELDLIRSEQQHDRVKEIGVGTVLAAVFGLALVAVGYYALIHMKELLALGLLVGAVATTVGTYLLFIALLPAFMKLLKQNQKLNDQKLNAFTLAQLHFRVNNLTKVLATVAMLIALGVGAMAGGLAFQNNVALIANVARVYDVTLQDPALEDSEALKTMAVEEQLTYRYKIDDNAISYVKEDLLAHPPLISSNSMTEYRRDSQPIRVSAQLPAGISSTSGKDSEPIPEQWEQAIRNEFISSYSMLGDRQIQIVDQSTFAAMKGDEHTLLLAKVDDFLKYKPQLKAMQQRQIGLLSSSEEDGTLMTKYGMYESLYAFTSGTMFMGFFLGIAFLAMMASCLMFKILSGATRDRGRYQMLRKIGVRKSWLVGSIYKELFLVFIFPALMGLLHVWVGMKMFSVILLEPYVQLWIPTLIFALIYAVYYGITVQLYRGIVLSKEA
ncbi:ABC transporter permease [Brevibacillus centrosporus]|uniref:FtsX-like permease family protein n=1 Tax=Brevibacillus centrosporus TaxID=54910 RepID=UPI000F0A0A99|nr:ABC transporter permease [Brevibacillus centrosporus]MEC2127583.1 ABC transporter permease [Brevibacillus centrosporus]RNB68097.1 ABC transporter permease [Brevibacillus centrosporus]GED30232.1 ABC transporter permease [Brevibacillus centrosporus]